MNSDTNTARICDDISWDEYCQIQRMNGSTLVKGYKSMLSLRNCMTRGVVRNTEKMRFGNKLHCLLLEPDRFESEHVVMPDYKSDPRNLTKGGDRSFSRTGWVKEQEEQFGKDNAGREIITRQDYDRALAMIEAVRTKQKAVEWLREGQKEITVLGRISDIDFKGRVDILTDSAIVDLKATGDVGQQKFGRVSANFRYAEKLAIYRELVRQATGETLDVWVIAQEDGGDFDTVIYRYPEALLDYAMKGVQAVLWCYKQGLEHDYWPGADGGKEYLEIFVPNWAMPEDEALDWSDA